MSRFGGVLSREFRGIFHVKSRLFPDFEIFAVAGGKSTLRKCEIIDAAAEAQSGNATALESGAKEWEGLQKPRGFLPRIPLLWKPPSGR